MSSAATGTDATGAVSVTVDALGRLTGVDIAHLSDDLRRSEALATTFRAAYSAALAAGLPPADPVAGRVAAKRVVRPDWVPLENVLVTGRRPAPLEVEEAGRPMGGERGVSDNECVTAVLDDSGPGGEVHFDPGWLSQARSSNVAAAIVQAFAAAHEQREAR